MLALAHNPSSDFPLSIQHAQLSNYMNVASFTILVYNYFLLSKHKTLLFWPLSFKSPVKFLFIWAWYMPFFDMGICIWQYCKNYKTLTECSFALKGDGWATMAGFIAVEVILCIRTWVVWNKSRVIAVGLSAWIVSGMTAALTVMGLQLDKITGLLLLIIIKAIQNWDTLESTEFNRIVYQDMLSVTNISLILTLPLRARLTLNSGYKGDNSAL
ncbi:uncharacterized protein FOMMEDRAFT_27268 [Fomitiporia mediterranea MF3/22]|uniref:uncharacterized protein n=1 Tax=Fomitiporia mediterranea (strain MF3/22) TaxID=694068 RepID=UPI000440758C|nr:uncharacterized protein FOMMEDRAFT_27268 [Fomitiporia mediterranea MF3/22]EJD05004.1 hypothetical protein FOMMEDRAFT_27268 [Fomitiporia mediterranea MF3/22]